MGRKVLKPDYDKVAKWLYEGMPPEIRDKFIQAFLRVDSPEEGAQRLLGVDSLEEGAQKLLGVDSPEVSAQRLLGVDSLEEAILKLTRAKEQQQKESGE